MRRMLVVAGALALATSACGSRVRSDVWDQMAQGQRRPWTAATFASAPDDTRVAAPDETATTMPATRAPGARTATTQPGALPAPADGNYVYDETDEGGMHSTTTEHWTAQRKADAVTVTSTVVDKQGDGSTTTTTDTYRVTKDAYVLLNDHTTYSDDPTNPDDCTYKPPMLILQLPMKVGDKWQSSDGCAGDDASNAGHKQAQVTGTATDVIGGVSVNTFVVRITSSFDSTDATTGQRTTFTETDSQHFDPSTLLIVSEDATTTVGKDASSYHRQLTSLTPT